MSNLARKWQYTEEKQKQVQKKTVTVKKTKRFTKGEKLFYLLFACFLCYFSSVIITNQASIYDVNKQIQILESEIGEQEKVVQDLKSQVDDLSRYGRLLDAAKKQGLGINTENVKVVKSKE